MLLCLVLILLWNEVTEMSQGKSAAYDFAHTGSERWLMPCGVRQ